MSTFVLVPGAWLGGWCWRDVAASLRAGGHTVIAATLTGLGERAHLCDPQIGLDTHVSDIVAMLHYQDLTGIILVGHSYGGTVVTAVAAQVPQRIRCLVYLDASVPRDGESNNDVIGPEMTAQLRSAAMSDGDGWRVPPARYVTERLSDTIRPWVAERLTPHPLRCFEQPARLGPPVASAPMRAFIRTSPQSALYERLVTQAREAGWYCRELTGGHYAMFTQPLAVAAALAELPI